MSTDRLLNLATAPRSGPSEPGTQNGANDRLLSGESSPSTIRSRFRAGVQAVTAAQRVVSGPSNPTFHSSPTTNDSSQHRYQWSHTGPLEPGINPNHPQPQFAHLSNQPVSVDVVDYSDAQVRFQSFEPALPSELHRLERAVGAHTRPFTAQAAPQEETSRPPWAAVRWINVNGLSWEVIKLLAIQYQLHPLAVEDCLHTSARSKSEYYKQHLFVHAAVHTLEERSEWPDSPPPAEKNPSKPGPASDRPLESGTMDPEIDPVGSAPSLYKSSDYTHEPSDQPIMDLRTATNGPRVPGKEVFDAEREVVRQLTKDYKVRIHVEKLSIFLLRDGTLITIFSHDGSKSVLPLLARLKSMDTLLRSSADGSMLLQAVLDIVVDQALDVVEAFRSKLTGLEAKVLVSPDLDTVRHLHVLSGELLLLKRTLNPLSTLVHGIMNHDPSERRATNYRGTQRSSESERGGGEDVRSLEPQSSTFCTGFLSSQAKAVSVDLYV
ncbi:hypothetical protein, variant [Puccinia triticina 1-1 BBBD Race 1]|uniref:Uncharacterized protein n=1 Tax=Puccinia triticina (isolate 1-1 / race 1 (BBBD)) TaxID=630390 RepID=A0A180GLK9_PUCT1|nr:hypothetical protein, variant [Puccinia triticina 1-1 BBBD Race 1]